MPLVTTRLIPILSAAAVVATFGASGCGQGPDEAIPVDHRMGFLADSMRQGPAVSPEGYILHPPAWARIHRDSLCLVLDIPDGVAKLFILDVILRNPRTGDSLGFGQAALSSAFRNRDVSCLPVRLLGGRMAWQAPAAVELTLKEFPGSAVLASRKLVVDPDFAQLDLQPFPVRFFPDRPGMEWLLEAAFDPGESFRQIQRLVSWTVLQDDPDGICSGDSIVRLQYHARECAPGNPPSPDADLLRCSAALDSALAAGPLDLQERKECAREKLVQLDSAILSNGEDGYGADFLYGKSRATHRSRWQSGDGYSWDIRRAEGIGDYSYVSVDSAKGARVESRIPAAR